MRIVSGKYKSRRINHVEDNKTRPTTDKNRENIFNIIGPYFYGGNALDLFCGSGALGIEALSRGIDFCYFCDTSTQAVKVLNKNLKDLKILDFKLYQRDYKKVLKLFENEGIKLDLILLDPPYKFMNMNEILNLISQYQILNDDGIIVTETSKDEEIDDSFAGFSKSKETNYGISKVCVFK